MIIIIRLYRRRGSFLLRDQKEPKVLINPAGAFAAQGLPTLKNRERLFLLVYAYWKLVKARTQNRMRYRLWFKYKVKSTK